MNLNKNQIIAVTVVAGVVTAAYLNGKRVLHKDLYERFPSIDRKVIRKAYAQFLKNAAANKYGDMDGFHDNMMDRLFLEIVRDIENPLRKK